MSMVSADRISNDLAVAFSYEKVVTKFTQFIKEEMLPALDRLEAAGYPGTDLLMCAVQTDPAYNPDFIGQLFDIVHAANGQPGAAHWLLYRAHWRNSMDEVRNINGEEGVAAVAFDHKFTATYPELATVISHLATEKARRDLIETSAWGRGETSKLEDVVEVDGRPLEEIQAEILAAVANLTGTAAAS